MGESVSLGLTPILFLESTVVEEICENCSLIGFTKFGKGDLSQSTSTNFGVPCFTSIASTRIGVTDSVRLTEFYLKVSPFGEPFSRSGNFTKTVLFSFSPFGEEMFICPNG